MKLIEVDLVNASKGDGWELHREGCADVAKTIRRYGARTRVLAATNASDAMAEIIDDELAEMGYDSSNVKIFPCVDR